MDMRNFTFCFLFLVLSLINNISFGDGNWAVVKGPRNWSFPRDHGSHRQYRTEWWYFTGNLSDEMDGIYGYQLTFFRHGISFIPKDSENRWSMRDIYAAHFAITDFKRKIFKFSERISREGPGLSGAREDSMALWILNWSAHINGHKIFLRARDKEMEIDLELIPLKPPILHGERGVSKKGPGEGQASYYSSFTDMNTKGILRIGNEDPERRVMGRSWFDHEFGSNQLAQDQVGWDWFGLQISDRRELMIYLIRLKDGSIEPNSSGTIVERDGKAMKLGLSNISVIELEKWRSPKTGTLYPAKWRIKVPQSEIDLIISPIVNDQELITTGVIYWEGAVMGSGISGRRRVSCKGYVELTGYAGSMGGIF